MRVGTVFNITRPKDIPNKRFKWVLIFLCLANQSANLENTLIGLILSCYLIKSNKFKKECPVSLLGSVLGY